MAKNDPKLLKLNKTMTKTITDLLIKRRAEGATNEEIRKGVFKDYGIDLTLYKFEWEPVSKKGPVPAERALTTTHQQKRSKEIINYKHEFTQDEIVEKAHLQATAQADLNALKDQKKSVMSDFNAKIQAKQETINEYARQVNSGVEPRRGECEIIKDFDKGIKTAYLDGKVVLEEKLTTADYTLQFPDEE